jgi:hypothetical protein
VAAVLWKPQQNEVLKEKKNLACLKRKTKPGKKAISGKRNKKTRKKKNPFPYILSGFGPLEH